MPVVDPLLNDGRSIEIRMVAAVPTVLQGAGRCISQTGVLPYDISASQLRLGERNCEFESGSAHHFLAKVLL